MLAVSCSCAIKTVPASSGLLHIRNVYHCPPMNASNQPLKSIGGTPMSPTEPVHNRAGCSHSDRGSRPGGRNPAHALTLVEFSHAVFSCLGWSMFVSKLNILVYVIADGLDATPSGGRIAEECPRHERP